MEKKDKEKWQSFLEGKWQKEVPKKQGRYYVADHKGNISHSPEILYRDPSTGNLRQACSVSEEFWGAYWWSEPIPDLPRLEIDEKESK